MKADTDSSDGLVCSFFNLLTIFRTQIATGLEVSEEDFVLQNGFRTLEGDQMLVDCGIMDEGEISVHMSLDGGKRKRKKKQHTTPKKIPHKHKARSKALLDYFTVDDSTGKVRRLKEESPVKPGVYMADHQDRYTCGLSGTMYYKVDKSGNRLPPPKQNKPQAKKVEAKKEDPKKGKKKK